MIRIQATAFKDCAKELIIKANTQMRPDIKKALEESLTGETGNAERAIKALLENQAIASEKKIPLCQDTGYVSFFLEKGPGVCIEGDLSGSLNEATAEIYKEMSFRQSMVADPIKRTPLAENIPVSLYFEEISAGKVNLRVIVKGAGSDNASALNMFLATTPRDEISDWIVARVSESGPKSCPPLVISIGVGGSFEKCSLLSKKGFFRKAGERNPDPDYALWEEELLKKINALGIGPSAFGGKTTALEVFLSQAPVHMASMPVALNIGCHALRTAAMEVGAGR